MFLPHLSFSDRLSSVVRLSVSLSVTFHTSSTSPFDFQIQWANFNQTWHKASLGEGDTSLLK